MSTQAKATIGRERYRTIIETDDHNFVTDEPISVGGKDLGPNPGELLSAALAACAVATMKMYAQRKGWDLQEAVVEVDFEWNMKESLTNFIKITELKGNLDDEQRRRLLEIADRCPVHKVLSNPVVINSSLI